MQMQSMKQARPVQNKAQQSEDIKYVLLVTEMKNLDNRTEKKNKNKKQTVKVQYIIKQLKIIYQPGMTLEELISESSVRTWFVQVLQPINI